MFGAQGDIGKQTMNAQLVPHRPINHLSPHANPFGAIPFKAATSVKVNIAMLRSKSARSVIQINQQPAF